MCDTCLYIHFSRAFQEYSFQICSFCHKKTQTGLCTALFPTLCITTKQKISKNPLNFYLIKVKQFHGDSVRNESARVKEQLIFLARINIIVFKPLKQTMQSIHV